MQLSKDELNSVFQSAEWTWYLKAKQRTLMQSLENMQERQLRETRYKLDKEIQRDFTRLYADVKYDG